MYIMFIISTVNDMRRTQQGLYHFPKLNNANDIKENLCKVFAAQVKPAIDPDEDEVGFLFGANFEEEMSHMKEDIQDFQESIAKVVRQYRDQSQPLEVRVKDVYVMALREHGISIPVLQIS